MKTTALCLLVVASATGYATAAEPDAAALESAMTKAASTLAGRSDPDSLAAAAVLAKVADATRAEQLAGRASAAAPKRLDLLWLHSQLCRDVQGCDRGPIDSTLHALDPENGAVFIPRLQDADGRIDPAETDRLHAPAAPSNRVGLYWNAHNSHHTPARL